MTAAGEQALPHDRSAPANKHVNDEQSYILHRMKDEGVAYLAWLVC